LITTETNRCSVDAVRASDSNCTHFTKLLLAGNFEKVAEKLDWACLRHNSLLQKVIEGRFQGKKTPGRPRAMLLDTVMQEDEENEIDYAKLKEKAHDRETLRH